MASELTPATTGFKPTPKQRLQRKFGENFPDLNSTDGKDWRLWVEGQRKRQEPIMRDKRLHWSRHRHFRAGHQWISTRDGRLWREPQADSNDIKAVLNIVGPALDFRLGILSEQRPGFRYESIGGGVAGREAAEAQQAVAEYYFYILRAWNIFLDAWYHAQTDGVAFVHVYVDKYQGPQQQDIDLIPQDDERYMGLVAQGYEQDPQGNVILPYEDEGKPAPPGAPARILYEGDICSRVVLAHEVIFDPEARTVNGPHDKARWAVVRRIRDVAQARLETGVDKIESEMLITSQSDVLDMPIDRSAGWQRGLPPFPTRRQRVQEGVPEYLIWITPDPMEPGLENGKWLRVIGNEIVEGADELPGGVIPLARVFDGSSDTDIYPRPIMSDWIGDQVAINALLSMLLKHARWFSGGKLMAMKNTVIEETFSSIVGSVVEYTGMKPEAYPAMPAGQDAWRLLDWLIKKLEDKHAWNDIARGQLTGSSGASASDISGRAVLATRELFERAFGPMVRAGAEGATEWSHIVIRYAKWLFDTPRLIPAVGGRGDLAKRISGETLGDKPMVFADPETMMPLPRALRQQQNDEHFQMGMIDIDVWQKNSVYGDVRNMRVMDTDQYQRAQWMNTMLEEQYEQWNQVPPEARYAPSGMPVLYQDNPTIHKSALVEIIFDERRPWLMRQIALERWGVYDQLERYFASGGMLPLPPEIIGAPMDIAVGLSPPTATVAAGGVAAAGQPGESPVSNSPSPNSSPVVPTAEKDKAQPLGAFGAVERQAKAAEQQQS